MNKRLDRILFCLQICFCLFLCLGLRQQAAARDIRQITSQEATEFLNKPLPSGERQVVKVSKTPTQFADVTESDYLLYNEKELYYLFNNELKVLDCQQLTIRSFAFENFYPLEIIATQDLLVVLGIKVDNIEVKIKEGFSFTYEQGDLEIKIIRKKDFKTIRTILFHRSFNQGIKLINNELIVTLFNYDIVNSEKKVLLYPRVSDSLFGESALKEDKLFFHPDNNNIPVIFLIYRINLQIQTPVDSYGLLGVDGITAVSKNYIILSSTVYKQESQILIHLFSLHKLTFLQSIKLNGYLTNEFSIDTYGSYLRVGITRYQNEEVANILYNIEIAKMSISGQLAYGHSETVYAIRFYQNRCFISTFLYYSPLLIVNFENPKKLLLTKNLQIDFVSEYLWISNHLFCLGRRLDDFGNSEGLYFAIYDLDSLIEKDKYLMIEKDLDCEVRYNYRALTIYEDYLLFPVNNHDQYSVMVFQVSHSLNLVSRIEYSNEFIHRSAVINNLCFFFSEKNIIVTNFIDFSPIKTVSLS